MKNIDALNHTRGRSVYVDDIPVREGCLYGAVFASSVACGTIRSIDVSEAQASPGVFAVLTAADIPGENQIGNILPDEPLFAEEEVQCVGQPIALVLATSEDAARVARECIVVEYDEQPPVLDPREAARRGEYIVPPRTFALGDPDAEWDRCAHVFEGRVEIGGQEHLYIEAQGAYAFPVEGGGVQVTSSTQGPTQAQRAAARVLGLPMHKVIVDVGRLGGGFGGKEDQATGWAVMSCLAAVVLDRPVKLVLHRLDDMRMTGKRHPYSADYRIGLTEDLKIRVYEVSFFQNAGSACDLSPAVLERTLFHATGSYFVPHVRAHGYSCRTNLPPNTAFRGFGGPQGMFVMEAAIVAAAESLVIPAHEIQGRNLLRDGDEFSYGQIAAACRARPAFERCCERFDLAAITDAVDAFNRDSTLVKKGVALMPVCFGISFTKIHLNQARALVHIYQDGSIGVSTGAVEMGQGVNTKMLQVVSRVLAVDTARVKIETTNTTRIANTSPTAASAGSDLNGKAVEAACVTLRGRLLEVARDRLQVAEGAPIELRDEQVLVDGMPGELSGKTS